MKKLLTALLRTLKSTWKENNNDSNLCYNDFMLSIKRFDNWSIYYGKEKVVMRELIDKAAVVAELDRIEYETNYEPFTEEVLGKRKVCKDIKDLLDKLKISDMVSYEKKYKEALGWMKSLYGGLHGKTKEEAEKYFPELAESEDERIRKELIAEVKDQIDSIPAPDCRYKEDEKALKQLNKWLAWLEKQGGQKLANSAKTCKNDTLLDLLNKIQSCITVDGIDYHFVMKKTSIYIAYYACYKGNGEEGRGNAIFGITAHSPIDLLNEMLEILKEKGLLE